VLPAIFDNHCNKKESYRETLSNTLVEQRKKVSPLLNKEIKVE